MRKLTNADLGTDSPSWRAVVSLPLLLATFAASPVWVPELIGWLTR